MPSIERIGDPWDCGDTQGQGSGNVFANGIPVARITDQTEGHGFPPISVDSASATVFANFKAVSRKGDHHATHCDDIPCHDGSFAAGSPDVIVDDRAGSMSNVPLSNSTAAAYGLDKASAAAQGVTLTYGHLAEAVQDDDFSSEDETSTNYAVVNLDTYVNVVPNTADITNNPPPAGLNSVQSRKFIPIRPPGGGSGIATQQEIYDSTAYGHDPKLQKAQLGSLAPASNTVNTTDAVVVYDDIDAFAGIFPASFVLSTNFTLGQLSFGDKGQPRVAKHPLIAQGTVSIKDIVKNLRALAINVLEPMLVQFPDMLINSGFRIPVTGSQHTKGQAADVYVPSLQSNKDLLYQGALWIRDNINYDQFIFETAGRNIWYHVSYNIAGNKPKTSPIACLTTATGGSPYTHSIVRLV